MTMTEFDPLSSIQRFYDAENEFVRADPSARDISVMLAELDPEVVVHVPDSLPTGGLWRGYGGFTQLFDAVTEHWSVFEVIYNEAKWHQIDERRVLTEGRLRAQLRRNARRIEMPAPRSPRCTPKVSYPSPTISSWNISACFSMPGVHCQ